MALAGSGLPLAGLVAYLAISMLMIKEGLAQLTEWIQQGTLKYREDVVDGLERAPAALIGLLQGQNFGR